MKDKRLVQTMVALTVVVVLILPRLRKRHRPQQVQADVIKLEVDDKTGYIKKLNLPADLPVEQRVIALIPFLDSLRVAIKELEASSRKHARRLFYLTWMLVIMTIALVVLGVFC